MPTIDIPDKICSHCGGIRWRIEKYTTLKKGVVTRYRCSVEHSERTKRYYNLHIDVCRERNRIKQLELNKTPKMRNYHKLRTKHAVDNLTDNYVRKVIYLSMNRLDNGDIKYKEIPKELVEIKRKQLLLTRQIKNNGKDKNSY
jgi:hypothetical protein